MQVVSINPNTREIVIKTGEDHFNLYELDLINEIDTEDLDELLMKVFADASNVEAADAMLREKGVVLRLLRAD